MQLLDSNPLVLYHDRRRLGFDAKMLGRVRSTDDEANKHWQDIGRTLAYARQLELNGDRANVRVEIRHPLRRGQPISPETGRIQRVSSQPVKQPEQ